MSRWDGLKSNADQSHASNQHRRHRPRPGSGGGGGRRQTQQQQQQQLATASWRRGAGPSSGGGDAEAKQAFDRDLRLLEQKLKGLQDAEHSGVGDAAAAVEEALLALQVQQRQKWLRFDPKRVGWSVESLFRAVQCMTASGVGVEPLVYDMTADALEMLRGSSGGDSWRMSTARTSECVAALVLRFRSLVLVGTAVVAETGAANVVSTTKSILQCLNAIFTKLGSILPAEETAERVVRPLFVPVLESARSSGVTGDAEQSCRQALCRSLLPATMGCISSLVSQKRQASAILAPLVLDILEDGDEREVANPLRLQLLSLLQGSLLSENDETVLASTCGCFSDILDAVYFIDRGNKARGKGSGKEATDINVASTARRIRTLLERSSSIEGRGNATDSVCTSISNLRIDILRLLSSLARAYPKAMAGQWAFFLEETPMLAYDPLSSPLKSASSGLTASSPLLVTFIQSGDSKEEVAAMEAGRALICALPLKLWFGLGSRRDGRRTFTGTTSLASRVAKALGQLLAALKSAVLVSTEQISSDEIVIEACNIVEVVIQTEPFLYDETLALALTDLLDTLRMLIIKQLSKRGSTRDTVAVVIIRAFVKGTGGTINPKGDLISLSKPVEEWLSRAENRKFLFRLFSMLVKPANDKLPSSGYGDGNNEDDNFLFSGNISVREEAGTLLMLVLRMAPSILGSGNDVSGWTPHVFSSAVQSLLGDSDPKRRQLGLQFVRHYVQGRNDFLSEERSPFVCEAFGSVLLRALGDTNAGIRSSSAATYGLFLRSDWANLLEQSSDHFHHLLQMCVGKDTSRMRKTYEGESSAGVRSEACKAIGNMCSECCRGSSGDSACSGSGSEPDQEETPLHIEGLDQIVRNVLDTVTIAVDDKNAGVRGMALFCIGNLSLSLQTAAGVISEGVASNSSLPMLCTSVHKCLEDKNDKVVGNAIRTSGHLLSLLRSSGDEGSIQMSDALYRCTVVTLTQKLNLALDIAEGKATNMSWKQRSIAKKHSWGSCHTLGVLLPCASSEEEPNRKLFLAAISQMIRCIQLARSLSEKVTAAAAAALKQTPMDMWREFSGATTIIADGLVACLIVVYEEAKGVRAKRLSPPIRNDVQDLLNLFLAISSADDAISSFSNEAISPGILDFLYSWMVDKGSKSSSFDSIATALTSNERVGEFEVSIEQRFSSRARHERRREGASPDTKADRRGEEESFVAINSDSRDGNDDSDEEDEL